MEPKACIEILKPVYVVGDTEKQKSTYLTL